LIIDDAIDHSGRPQDAGPPRVRIIVDSREPRNVEEHLARLGAAVERRTISPADFVLSSDCAVERKTVSDFMASLFSGRLFEQATALKGAYSKPLVIVEGDIEMELRKRQSPRPFWGAMVKLQAEMGIPVVTTPTPAHSADALYVMAKRLQKDEGSNNRFVAQNKPRSMSPEDWRLFIVASLPYIGDELAARLLAHFKSVRKIFLASEDELEEVEGIGKAKAKRISQLLDEIL
jgi:ERCC4-type nuclease